MSGVFITFEGGEGVGKSTQIQHLAQALESKGHDVIVTREPGGCPSAEAVRDLLFSADYDGTWTPEAETLMMFAARAQHIQEVIAPALTAGKTVLCDRYMDSTRVYQGDVNGVELSFIENLEKNIIKQRIPDLTVILDLEAKMAMNRVYSRGAQNKNDLGDTGFYEALREGFLHIAQDNPERCAIVDASQEEQTIATQILSLVEEKLR